eukprot:m.513552 g.513552  ORF g.513552 m.513552 type:complete len:69 (+) comp111128_c0_seq1:105-311(+)
MGTKEEETRQNKHPQNSKKTNKKKSQKKTKREGPNKNQDPRHDTANDQPTSDKHLQIHEQTSPTTSAS